MAESQTFPIESGPQFTAGHLGPIAELMQYRFAVPALGDRKIPGKVFLKESLGLTGVEMSWNTFPAGVGMPFQHRHRENEEVYLFISGHGEFMVDNHVFAIQEGSVVRVAPDGVRAYRNTGTEPLHFVVLQVKADSMVARTVEDGVVINGPIKWDKAAA